MYEQLKSDFENIELILENIKNQGTDFIKNLNNRPTSVEIPTLENGVLNDIGLGALETLELFNAQFEPIIAGSSGPRYWGFVTGGATPAAIAGDWLSAVYDQNSQSIKGQGDVSAIIELETVKLVLDLFELPKDYLGGFVSGATMSNFTCLAVARQWFGKQYDLDFAKDGITKRINILSALPHSSAIKSLSMLGIGSNNFTKVNIENGNRESIDIQDLEQKIQALDGAPFILITSAGTVNTVDFDDFKAISKLKEKYNFWWHIDAAFGAFAVCSPAHKHLLSGWEIADSITIDFHKWLNVPYENAIFLVKNEHRLAQMETFQNTNAPYLGNPLENFSYLNLLPENSRRLKALPVWFTLKAYGKIGYQSIVENSINMANILSQFIEKSNRFELLAPTRLNNVCFTLSGDENQEKVPDFLLKLNQTKMVFMTPTVYNGKKGIRASFVNWRTQLTDIELVINEMNNII